MTMTTTTTTHDQLLKREDLLFSILNNRKLQALSRYLKESLTTNL